MELSKPLKIRMGVVYFNQLSGAAGTRKLVEKTQQMGLKFEWLVFRVSPLCLQNEGHSDQNHFFILGFGIAFQYPTIPPTFDHGNNGIVNMFGIRIPTVFNSWLFKSRALE